MRVLYLSQYFLPEVGATQIRAYEMATGLIRAGHQVTMLTEVPNHPKGIIHPEYRGRFWARETLDGIHVIRVWVKTSSVKTVRTRMAFYLSYMISAVLAGLILARGHFDVIYATSPPLFVGGAALALSLLRHTPMVFEIRDLWPESAVTLGELRSEYPVRLATWLEETCYRRARLIVVTAQEILERLSERSLSRNKLALIRNGANVDLFKRDIVARQRVRAALGLEGRFVVLYAGLFGLAYELDLLLKVAHDMETRAPDVHFLLIGDGPIKDNIQSLATALGLINVTFLPSQAREIVPDYFNAADVSLVPIKEPNIFGMLPVKIYDSMACELPLIVSATGEAGAIVRENDAGLVITPGDKTQLRDAILQLHDNPDLPQRYGQNGRRAVLDRYSRKALARQLVELLEGLQTA